MHKKIFFSILVLVGFQCQKTAEQEAVVYANNFEGRDLAGIDGGRLFAFGSTAALGNYNNDGFSLNLEHLPRHDLLTISFDLYLHDSWDGNTSAPDGPDIWYMEVDGKKVIEATFSNSPCASTYCLYQSFPDEFPSFNNPRTGSSTSLPGLCHFSDSPSGTAMYQIMRTTAHTDSEVSLTFGDKLVQTNTGTPACDESWSIGRIEIKALILN